MPDCVVGGEERSILRGSEKYNWYDIFYLPELYRHAGKDLV